MRRLQIGNGSPLLLLLVSIVVIASCASGPKLTDEERAKLDPPLQTLIDSDGRTDDGLRKTIRDDGETAYAVLIRCSDLEALKAAGLSLDTSLGDIMTARLTVAEIKTAAALPEVDTVESGGRRRPN